MNRPRQELGPRLADAIARAAIEAAEPAGRVGECWSDLRSGDREIVVLAVGKAAAAMANEAFGRLGERLQAAVVVCPAEHVNRLVSAHRPVRVFGADHPTPTARNLVAAGAVAGVADHLGEADHLVVLLSGGASAYLCRPADGIGLDELQRLTKTLLATGATIGEVNTVRKHVETLKGGGLAQLVWPAQAEVLVLSDVLGDPMDVIGSGPMAPDPTTFADAVAVLERRGIAGNFPSIDERLQRGVAGELNETAKEDEPCFARVQTSVIGNNSRAIDSVRDRLGAMGWDVVDRRGLVEGEASEIGRDLAQRVNALGPGQAVVWGGETTVCVGETTGVGGPCQELALAGAMGLNALGEAAIVAFATDGIDGPTDAAGAWAISGIGMAMDRAGIDSARAMADHDSGGVFHILGAGGGPDRSAAGGLIVTGSTGTNVNDVYVGVRA